MFLCEQKQNKTSLLASRVLEVVFVWSWYQCVVSFRGSVDDNFISCLAIPRATLAAVTSHLHCGLISMCVSWHCHLHAEMDWVSAEGTVFPKASDKLRKSSAPVSDGSSSPEKRCLIPLESRHFFFFLNRVALLR